MKLLLSVLAFSLTAATAEAAAVPVDVQLNNPAFRAVVKSYLDGRRAQYRFVKAAGADNFLKITITEDLSHGASCSLSIEGKASGSDMQATASKASSFVWPSNRAAYCQKAIAGMLEDNLQIFDL